MKQFITCAAFFLLIACTQNRNVVTENSDSERSQSSEVHQLQLMIDSLEYVSYKNRVLTMNLTCTVQNTGDTTLLVDNSFADAAINFDTIATYQSRETQRIAPRRSLTSVFPLSVNLSTLFDETSRDPYTEITLIATYEYKKTDRDDFSFQTIQKRAAYDFPYLHVTGRIQNFKITAPPRDKIMDALTSANKNPLEAVSILSIFAGKYNEKGIEILNSVNFNFTVSYDIVIENRHATPIDLTLTEYSLEIEKNKLASGSVEPRRVNNTRFIISVSETYSTQDFDRDLLTAYTTDAPNYLLTIQTNISTGDKAINEPVPALIQGGGIIDK